jgi:hypothetical protein
LLRNGLQVIIGTKRYVVLSLFFGERNPTGAEPRAEEKTA